MHRLGCALVGCALISCAAVRTDDPVAAEGAAAVIAVPFYAQQAHQCGPASLAMALAWSGRDVDADKLVDEVYTPRRKGSLQPGLVAGARRHGRVAYPLRGSEELGAEIAAGNPVVVLQNLGLSWLPRWHYAVVIGRDRAGWTLHSGRRRALFVADGPFRRSWERGGEWGLLVLPPDRIAATATEKRWLEAVVGLERTSHWDAAAAGYRAALRRWPGSLIASIGLGNATFAMGRLQEAEDVLSAAVAEHAEAATAWNNLAHVLAARGRREQALAAAGRAIELGGADSAAYQATLTAIEAAP